MIHPPPSMPFRISTYLTLLVACLALGYSEWDLVPESIIFTAVVVVSLIVSFFLEGRISLGLGKANLLGLVIGIVAVGWLAVKLTQPTSSALASLSWPANLLPYMGPLVMILIPAKLFRPKHVGDWWTMHGIGLATVVLASSMTDDPFFIVLIALYSAAAVWSLSLFFSNRQTGAIPPLPGKTAPLLHVLGGSVSSSADGERKRWRHALLWLGLANLVALPIFFLSPRSSGERWGFAKTRLETGYSPENTHDMGKTGDLEASAEVAFEVSATNPDGTAKTDFDPGQLWRGTSYSDYEIGSWLRKAYASGHSSRFRVAQPTDEYRGPNLGAAQYDLVFAGGEKVAGPVLSSPVCWVDDQDSPVSSIVSGLPSGWIAFYDGSFISPKTSGRVRLQYTQRTRAPDEAGLGSPMEPTFPYIPEFTDPQRVVLTQMRIPRIREWAVALLKKCVVAERLPQAVVDTADTRAGFSVQPDYHERVARVFRDYFLDSGEFEYSTKLRRVDKKIDPIEDFLWNAKAGHCERFASGLTLSLRSLGIPAQFVIGFKGFDSTDDSKLLIRQEHAHAWVEVLVPRTAPADFKFKNPANVKANLVYHWLNLDPTPGTLAAPVSSGSWFDNARQKGVTFLADFIIGYNPAKREQAVESIKAGLLEWSPYLAGGVAVVALIVLFRRRSHRGSSAVSLGSASDLLWYRRLLAALRSLGLHPEVGQTPKEFAERAGLALRASPAAAVSAVPAFVTSKLYRVRYAGSALAPAEESEVLAALATLEAAASEFPSAANLPPGE